MPLERYVAAVVAGEGGELHSPEALRALAVAARTYAIHFRGRHQPEGYDLCGTTHCQRADPAAVTPRIQQAAEATAGILLWYRGAAALALYSRDCGGVTEPGDAPYLRSHPDPYCGAHPWHWSAAPHDIVHALERSGLRVPRDLSAIEIARRTESGRVREAALLGNSGPVRIAAESFRLAIGRALGFATLRSDWWEARAANGRIEFTGRGEGHGVGLCQRGADGMGAAGKKWREILSFYYPGTATDPWTRLAGESAALFTTQPEQDSAILALASRYIREMETRTGWPAPRGIEIRVYPDLDSFRQATSEPGWVAAHTRGTKVSLQPASVLRAHQALENTLRHEIAHVFIESQARANLPVWFREGLAGYLSGGEAAAGHTDAIADRANESEARAANRSAVDRVSQMVRRDGLPAVLERLRSGMP